MSEREDLKTKRRELAGQERVACTSKDRCAAEVALAGFDTANPEIAASALYLTSLWRLEEYIADPKSFYNCTLRGEKCNPDFAAGIAAVRDGKRVYSISPWLRNDMLKHLPAWVSGAEEARDAERAELLRDALERAEGDAPC